MTSASLEAAAPFPVLDALFRTALASALPDGKFDRCLPPRPRGRTIVLGAGKAAASMARAFEQAWSNAYGLPCEGLVVTRYGHGAPTRWIEVVEAAHPVPDAAGLAAAQRILERARQAQPDDQVVCLVSGGASSLLTLPAPGLTLADKQQVTTALLASGAPISAINRVRKALSAIKGGRLAAAIRAPLATYLISDVPGDDLGTIGSGPTISEAVEPEAALAILRDYRIDVTARVADAIRRNVATASASSAHVVHVLARPRGVLEAAAHRATGLGYAPFILGDAVEGEARDVAQTFAGITRAVLERGDPVGRPCVLLSGGETTVTVRGKGRGGRNAEFALALAIALDGAGSVAALACDTDGIDGSEDNAGAWFDGAILGQARARGLDPFAHLANNDAYGFFSALDRLVMTGPTLTNVNDFRAILVQ